MHREESLTQTQRHGRKGFTSSRGAHIFKMAVERKILSHNAALFSFLFNINNVESKKIIKLTKMFMKQVFW